MFLAACSSTGKAGGSARMRLAVETQKPVELKGPEGRVALRVDGDATIFELRGHRFRLDGYSGYIGDLGSAKGWLKVGKLTLSYTEAKLTIRASDSWSSVNLNQEPLNLYVYQDGRQSESVFRD